MKRTDTTGIVPETVYYVGGVYEVRRLQAPRTEQVTKYYAAFGRIVAQRSRGEVRWLLADHLGSSSAVLDARGNVAGYAFYWPYGTMMEGGTAGSFTDKLFTGQRLETGPWPEGDELYNYKNRFYDPGIGRFVSADPTVAQAGAAIGWDRYAYTEANPLAYTDPSGLRRVEGGRCGGRACARSSWLNIYWNRDNSWERVMNSDSDVFDPEVARAILEAAAYYGLDPGVIAAIILNEDNSADWRDNEFFEAIQDGEIPLSPKICLPFNGPCAQVKVSVPGDPSVGIAQMPLSIADALEEDYPELLGKGAGDTKDRLRNNVAAVWYVGAFLDEVNHDLEKENLGEWVNNPLALIASYSPAGDGEVIRQLHTDGCLVCNTRLNKQIDKVAPLVDPCRFRIWNIVIADAVKTDPLLNP